MVVEERPSLGSRESQEVLTLREAWRAYRDRHYKLIDGTLPPTRENLMDYAGAAMRYGELLQESVETSAGLRDFVNAHDYALGGTHSPDEAVAVGMYLRHWGEGRVLREGMALKTTLHPVIPELKGVVLPGATAEFWEDVRLYDGLLDYWRQQTDDKGNLTAGAQKAIETFERYRGNAWRIMETIEALAKETVNEPPQV